MNPMRVSDPNDVCTGYLYAIVLHYTESKVEFSNPKDEHTTVRYESTLADAQCTLQTEAQVLEARIGVYMRKTSKNRFYGSDGGQRYELTIVPVSDPSQ